MVLPSNTEIERKSNGAQYIWIFYSFFVCDLYFELPLLSLIHRVVFYPAAATGDELTVAAISDFVCYAGVGGDGDREGGPLPFAAYHANLPTVRLDDRLANVEPNTRASYGLAAAV